jgi:hypothetical protein
MNKYLFFVALLSFGEFVYANIQEKLVVNTEKINVAKQNVRAGKPIIANDRCQKCGNKCQQAA